ncbi:dockerin type I domain-containing protein [Ruminococcus sp.]|uniref:dockerin type I domain-containing protein n=1 Tax=Ruminococcus sp. TaxID=41978 RepID=UPI0025FE4DBB|nr:dockerin type I domain-containing protein [Ruminococcus sp.]
MKIRKKMVAAFSGALIAAVSCMCFSLQANAELALVGYRGDVNQDGTLSAADMVQLQKYLLGEAAFSTETEWRYGGDLNADNAVNGIDLGILRQCLTGTSEWIGIYEEREDPTEPTEPLETTVTTETTVLTETTTTETTAATEITTETVDESPFLVAPIADIDASLPSQGEASLVIFYIDFPDCTYSNKLSAEELQEIAFGPENTSSENYPFESMSAFYARSSKGAMELNGQVFSYTAKNSISAYGTDKVALAKECFEAFKDSVDFSQYDSDGDGKIDATLFTVPETADNDNWWPCAGGFGDGEYTVDGVKVGHIITGNADSVSITNFNSSYLHEMGHCMGLPDYYLYYSDDGEGMHGSAGTELMDMDAYSDFSAFSKLMLGWYREDQISVYDPSQGAQTFQLKSAQTGDGNCVIIPYGKLDEKYFSEYFILEYSTVDGNNSGVASQWWTEIDSGVRIQHIQAEKYSDYWWTYFKYQNGSEFTNNDDDGIRLIRLVNDGGGVFKTGAAIDSNTSGFGWYDANEAETIDPGVTITVGALEDGSYTVTIAPKS